MTEVQLTLNFAHDHPSLAGHFPGRPIIPGVVLLDEVMLAIERQAAQLKMPWNANQFEIPVCKFLSPVLPGASLTLSLAPDRDGKSLSFRLQQAEQLVASGKIRPVLSP
jgi:3-hydroxymyristoyl/3-hydroxydecanoyl-(acyl carrier protein) dehydratase